MRRILLLSIFTAFTFSARAQWFVGVKFMGVSIHTDNNFNGHLYKTGLGKKKRVAFHFGLVVTAEYKFNSWFSLKAEQSGFRDCGGKLALMSMLNARYTINFRNGSDLSGGLGPFWYYRRTWTDIDGYKEDGYFKLSQNGRWQKKFVWYGGEIEYNYPITETLDWSTNVLPAIPVVIGVASGIRSEVR